MLTIYNLTGTCRKRDQKQTKFHVWRSILGVKRTTHVKLMSVLEDCEEDADDFENVDDLARNF